MSYKITYNAGYGGYGISTEGLKEYNRLCSTNKTWIARDDPILIQLIEKDSRMMSGPYCQLAIAEFPVRYKSFLKMKEYDGKETFEIDYKQYLIHQVKSIMDDSFISSNEKIKRIYQVYEEYEAKPY